MSVESNCLERVRLLLLPGVNVTSDSLPFKLIEKIPVS